MTTYTATAPNGKVFTRNTKNTYTHAGLLLSVDGKTTNLVSFSGTKAGAEKKASALLTAWRKGAVNAAYNEAFRAYCEQMLATWGSYVVVETEVAA